MDKRLKESPNYIRQNKIQKPKASLSRSQARRRKRKNSIVVKKIILTCFLAMTLVLSFKVIMNYTVISRLNNDIQTIEEEIAIKESEIDLLNAELEPFKSASRIEELAKLKLGLDYPKQNQYVEIDLEEETRVTDIEQKDQGFLNTIISALRLGE